jgi:hypothetical protein
MHPITTTKYTYTHTHTKRGTERTTLTVRTPWYTGNARTGTPAVVNVASGGMMCQFKTGTLLGVECCVCVLCVVLVCGG